MVRNSKWYPQSAYVFFSQNSMEYCPSPQQSWQRFRGLNLELLVYSRIERTREIDGAIVVSINFVDHILEFALRWVLA